MKRIILLLLVAALMPLSACSNRAPKPPAPNGKPVDPVETSSVGTYVEMIDDSFAWDPEGAKSSETFFISYLDATDEASVSAKIWCLDKDYGTAIIDRCSEIVELDARNDSRGPYLLIVYHAGEDEKGATGTCALRLSEEGQLAVAYANE
ncbi:MAG: hypothetical protein IKE22_13020 [Atopobiaceae bacterium]|nr:hypothetical protein [Atopobiaceae bacterium]